MKLIDTNLPMTTTARNVEFESYWEKKCKEKKNKLGKVINCRKEDHGNSYKQAFVELRI